MNNTEIWLAIEKQQEINKEILSRLESIERMLGEEKPLSPSEYKSIWYGEVEQEPEWRRKETAPDGKLVRITAGGFQGNLIGIKVEPNLWRAWKLNDYSNEVLFIPNVLVYSWRELNIEESAYAWDNRILGASAEHAELSTLELPISNQEPEWRTMSTAPRDGQSIKVLLRHDQDEFFAKYNGMWICTRGLEHSKGEYKWYFTEDDLKGWRPL